MKEVSHSLDQITAANQNLEERKYWLDLFSGGFEKSIFPADVKSTVSHAGEREVYSFRIDGELYSLLVKLTNGVHKTLHVVLCAGLAALLQKYSFHDDAGLLIGSPIYRQDGGDEPGKDINRFINTLLPLRIGLEKGMSFKKALMTVRQTVVEAVKHQDYPMGILAEQLELETQENGFPFFDVALLLENIHDKSYIEHTNPGMLFSFGETGRDIQGSLEYDGEMYSHNMVEKLVRHYINFLKGALKNPGALVEDIDILDEPEKQKLLEEFNRYRLEYPRQETIHQRFERQVEQTPDAIALFGPGDQPVPAREGETLTYRRLNEKANRLAHLLRRRGVTAETVVGLMVEPSPDMVVGLLAILKAGGAYLPIDPGTPRERVLHMLQDAGAKYIISTKNQADSISFTTLRDFDANKETVPVAAPPRRHIETFDKLPMPDRSLISLKNYQKKIGMASVTQSISLQSTRGCPYQCLFCHKVWSKHHVFRTAENIYNEVEFYYKQGVTQFSFIDDCFNLDRENSARFFKLVIKNRLKINIYFPNGLRGDLMTPDYIDLMVEAGCRGINLSLETASPRLQKLIKKHLDIDKFKNVMDYIAGKHPQVILEIATMHGFPTETEEEALMTLNFIKSIQWIHFPYIHILKIYPNTEMEQLALEHGVAKEDILRSRNLAFHELPDTLPWPKSFTRKYQSDFMNNYFLQKERLKKVLPVQMRTLSEKALVDKYNAYLPAEINTIEDIVAFTKLEDLELPTLEERPSDDVMPPAFLSEARVPEPAADSKKVLLLDLSQHFSSHSMLYNVAEQPLGLISILTYLRKELGDKIHGRVYKSGSDFDSFGELKTLFEEYRPDFIGIRTLTFFREFFHETAALLRQWGYDGPIVAGGPYATSDYPSILKDENVNLAVLGEGEYTLRELLEKMLENNFKVPSPDVLEKINGIAFVPGPSAHPQSRDVILIDQLGEPGSGDPEWVRNPVPVTSGDHLAYVMYTSGSTGKPKGVMVEHRQVNNCIHWMQEKFQLNPGHLVVQRTNLTFDPSVWEIFWPLYVGGGVKILDSYQRKDAGFLTRLMAEPGGATMMYCPATLVTAMAYLLDETSGEKPRLTMPWFIIGAEPIAMEVVKNFYTHYTGTIVNTYGPTECTINNTYYDLLPGDERSVVPIGYPVANNQVYILSKDHRLMPPGIQGEICIAGDSVARGYIDNRQKTEENFIPNPFGPGVLYKTGDIGRWLDDGTIEIMGRIDEQVKLRGYRIEPGEIENAVAGHDAIKECVVLVRSDREFTDDIKTCKKCGIGSNYPGVVIDEDRVCEACENFGRYKGPIEDYFKNLDELVETVKETNRENPGDYDCLLLYAGGRGAAYALYQLVDRGLKVLTATYDNNYFSKRDMENIKTVTSKLGVDHIVLKHPESEAILKESINYAATVCRGCFHVSSSLAADYAYRNGIKTVVGATLSRGQIIENKLFMFLQQGITDVEELEREVSRIQLSLPDVDRNIFSLIDLESIDDRSAYKNVRFFDFYRYCDVSNRDMIRYLDERDPYWKTKRNYAVYSTNCPIKQLGDYAHLKERGYHYYGSATGWERRLGHISLENFEEDLQYSVTEKGYENFLKRLGITPGEDAGTGQEYLVAYYVPQPGKEVDDTELRQYLSDFLPHYMVPPYLEPIHEIPLTPNGKLDKKALPSPTKTVRSSADYQPPEDDIQKTLVQVWHGVLGVDANRIGIDDNFFELGGDSIKAIQISAKLPEHSLKMEIQQLFAHPSIRELSRHLTVNKRTISQETVTGEVRLTPIQRWFFQRNFTDKHHFNHTIMIHRPEGFQQEIAGEVFTQIMAHHDALRIVFPHRDGVVTGVNRDAEKPCFEISVFDLTGREDQEDYKNIITKEADALHRGLNLEEGPLVRLGLFKTHDGDHLLFIIHHLMVDGVSWRILLEDFSTGYRQLESGQPVHFPLKTDSFKDWSHRLEQYASQEKALAELKYWKTTEQSSLQSLPVDFPNQPGGNKVGDSHTLQFQLPPAETKLLMTKVNSAYLTEINDILIAALGRAAGRWSDNPVTAITLEGHGRESIMQDIGISRTVGWFTTRFPVILDLRHCDGIADQIIAVKDTLHRVPNKGIGYGILRYLTPAEKLDGFTFELEPGIIFNYLGEWREGEDADSFFKMSQVNSGEAISPRLEQLDQVEINGIVSGGALGISFKYNLRQYRQETIQQLADYYRDALMEMIHHCTTREESEYDLSPLQAGMLFHSRMREDSSAYFEQAVLDLQGDVRLPLLKTTFQQILDKYDALRTVFTYGETIKSRQVLLKNVEADVRFRDLSHIQSSQLNRELEAFTLEDRREGFDLSKGPLMRLTLIKTHEKAYKLIWSFHHILMDGWCIGILFKDFMGIYRASVEGETIETIEKIEKIGKIGKETAVPYSRYIRWLARQDHVSAIEFWKNHLSGFTTATSLPRNNDGGNVPYRDVKLQMVIGEDTIAPLTRWGSENQVTLNTILQSAWGLLLQKYNDTGDAVFGSVVSGRPPEISGIETMVGLFINTLPVRVKSDGEQPVSQLFKQMQERFLAARSYEYLPLAEVQAVSPLKHQLIDHITVFENYPLQQEVRGAQAGMTDGMFTVAGLEMFEQTNYDLNVVFQPGRELIVLFRFNAAVYDPDFIQRIGQHFEIIIQQIAENPQGLVKDISLPVELSGTQSAVSNELEDDFDF